MFGLFQLFLFRNRLKRTRLKSNKAVDNQIQQVAIACKPEPDPRFGVISLGEKKVKVNRGKGLATLIERSTAVAVGRALLFTYSLTMTQSVPGLSTS